jgi:UDP-N-acetylmuramyl pentapeptide phosphotransferase/UDP-N-acetylglucosamine-1-phosphate transferase
MLLVIFCALVALVACAALTAVVVVLARGSAMLDAPGARRMHVQPTVRGAGLGFVLIIVAAWGALGWSLTWSSALGRWALCTSAAMTLVAWVSWIDDRRGLPVLPRLAAHLIGAALVVFGSWPEGVAGQWWCAVVLVLVITALINFWNFMDGINGIAAGIGALLGWILVAVLVAADDIPAAVIVAAAVGALTAFLPFNFPNARAFMGDVGSATLGLMVGALALLPIEGRNPPLWEVAALASAVFLDAGLTLLWRVFRRPRQRWYTAHREHLYQWLARSGWGHTRTTFAYLAWTAGPALGVVILGQTRPDLMPIATISLYLAGTVLWRVGRDRALAQARLRHREFAQARRA